MLFDIHAVPPSLFYKNRLKYIAIICNNYIVIGSIEYFLCALVMGSNPSRAGHNKRITSQSSTWHSM